MTTLQKECSICRESDSLEPSDPDGVLLCPVCWQLAWQVRSQLHRESGIPTDEISLESLIVEDLGLDSLDDLYAILAIEERTGIRVHKDDFANMESVRGVIATLRRRQDAIGRKNGKNDSSEVARR